MNSGSDHTPAPQRSERYHDAPLRRSARLNKTLFAVNIIVGLAFLVWAVLHLNYTVWYASLPYLLAEFIAFGSMLLWGHMMLERREHSPRGLPLEGHTPPVDIIVTCCGEPLGTIERTLREAARLDYPDYKVTVADDGADPEVADICRELGFDYLSRPVRENRKAGNLNYALKHTERPFVLTLDADQAPNRAILKRLMGYFHVPNIGYVTTYQRFEVPEGDPWANSDKVFHGSMQTARNAINAAISCGSGVIYRRAAIESIGGFSTWNLVEDLTSSMLMHAKQWRSVYHHYPATVGSAPAEVCAHVKQRWQWAVDSCRLLIWRNPLFTRGLTLDQRLSYLGFGYNYLLFGIAYPIFFLMPVFGLFTGKFLFDTAAGTFLLWRIPFLVTFYIFNRFITQRRHNMKAFCAQVGLFAVYFNALLAGLASRRRVPKYSVTSKVQGHPNLAVRMSHILPHLVFAGLNIAAVIYGYDHVRESNAPLYWINVAWAAWVICILLPFTRLAVFGSSAPLQHAARAH